MKKNALSLFAITFIAMSLISQNSYRILDKQNSNLNQNNNDTDSNNHDYVSRDLLTYGVLSLKEGESGKRVNINVYEANGKTWKVLKLNESIYKLIDPYSVNIDYDNLVLRVLKEEKGFYKVIINEKKGLVKYIRKTDNSFTFDTWGAHILKVFSVDFDSKTNPILADPSPTSTKLDYDSDEFYQPIEIKNEWLKIKWGSDGKNKYGWIKWKSKNRLLLSLYYTS